VRILLFSGKGGVGKTSLAAATGVRLADSGHRTLVLSVDPAHSLADSFALDLALFSRETADPVEVARNLALQEVNIQSEILRHWKEIASYVTSVLRTAGIPDVEAEEMAILPGMEELSALLYVNQYRREGRFDVIVLDCAPTAESVRFVSMPTTLEWYIKHVFPMQRTVLRAVRPIANRITPVELPPDRYFANVKSLFDKLEGVGDLLSDPSITSVRLVTNPERVVLRETQRAFVYFSLHALTVDMLIVNRVFPEGVEDAFFDGWKRTHRQVLEEIEDYFAPVLLRRVPLFDDEVLGRGRLERLAETLYPGGEDPSIVHRTERPFVFERSGSRYLVRLPMPFATRGEVGVFKKGDELVVEVGTLRRHIGLPRSMAAYEPVRAKLDGGRLTVEMEARS
jgi:arsenite-transporting ATPase